MIMSDSLKTVFRRLINLPDGIVKDENGHGKNIGQKTTQGRCRNNGIKVKTMNKKRKCRGKNQSTEHLKAKNQRQAQKRRGKTPNDITKKGKQKAEKYHQTETHGNLLSKIQPGSWSACNMTS